MIISNRLLFVVSLSFLWMAAPCLYHALGDDSVGIHGQANDTRDANPPEGSTAYYELKIRAGFKSKDYAGVKKLLDEAIKKYPQMSAFHELMGRYYMVQADMQAKGSRSATALYDKARYYLIRAISIDEKNVQARFHMLHVETETKHYSSAIVYCNDLLEENPYNEDLWRRKIDLYRRLGDNAEADRLLERICTIYPGDEQLRKDLVYRKSLLAKKQREAGDVKGQEQTLRALVDMEPKNVDYHRSLVNLLYGTGRIAEAAEAAGHGAAATQSLEFVEKRVGMLCEMNRHREAVEYVKGLMSQTKGTALQHLLKDLEMDAARAAQYNDAYTSYAKIYDSEHSIEALDYLVNTSIERWYLDDAIMYIEESLKRKGESQKMLYNQYIIYKRLGNVRKANSLLAKLYERYPNDEAISEEMMLSYLDASKELMDQGQYSEAAPMLEKVFYSNAYPYLRDAAFQRLYNCYFQTRQFVKAEKMLDHVEGTKRVTQTAALYSKWGKPKKALDFLANAYLETAGKDEEASRLIAYSYEEIVVPYVKEQIASGRLSEANNQLKEALVICPDNIDLLRYGINLAQRKGDLETVGTLVGNGRRLYPNDPYFILKQAQLRQLGGDHQATLNVIQPLLHEYSGDSLLVSLYAESVIEIAREYLKGKRTDEAMELVLSALEIAPDNSELHYIMGRIYEQKKEWKLAYECYRKYKPGNMEVPEFKHLLEEVSHRLLCNSLSLEYQQARPGTEDVISGNAYLNYAYKYSKNTTISAGLAYAGRDGAVSQGDTEMTKGGTGVQLSGGYEHDFTERFTAKAELAFATRYFPIVMARLSASYDLPHEWQISAFASYRLLRSYAGVYGWQSNIVNYEGTKPVYGNPEWVRKGWHESKNSMFQLGVGASKTLNNFVLSGQVSGLMFSEKFYFNSNLKMQFFPKEDNTSHIFAVGGVGTAPESSLIDRSMPVGFNKVNTFVGMGGNYVMNRSVTLGLSGTWYTMLSQSERLTTTYIANDPYIKEDYRNYFYVHASVLLSF